MPTETEIVEEQLELLPGPAVQPDPEEGYWNPEALPFVLGEPWWPTVLADWPDRELVAYFRDAARRIGERQLAQQVPPPWEDVQRTAWQHWDEMEAQSSQAEDVMNELYERAATWLMSLRPSRRGRPAAQLREEFPRSPQGE